MYSSVCVCVCVREREKKRDRCVRERVVCVQCMYVGHAWECMGVLTSKGQSKILVSSFISLHVIDLRCGLSLKLKRSLC